MLLQIANTPPVGVDSWTPADIGTTHKNSNLKLIHAFYKENHLQKTKTDFDSNGNWPFFFIDSKHLHLWASKWHTKFDCTTGIIYQSGFLPESEENSEIHCSFSNKWKKNRYWKLLRKLFRFLCDVSIFLLLIFSKSFCCYIIL